MDKSSVTQLIHDLRDHLGLPELELDDSNICFLSFDEMVVCIDVDAQFQTLRIFCPVADLPAANREELLLRLLQSNLYWRRTGDATVAVSVATKKIILQDQVPLQGLTAFALAARLEAFLNQRDLLLAKILEGKQPEAAGGPVELVVYMQV